MKKIFFAMAALFGCITMSQAQTSFIATLQHEGEFTHYYGSGALTSAYNAATEGDIITLSAGTFSWTSSTLFNKGVTLRGAGMEAEGKTFITYSGTDNMGIIFCATDSTKVISVEGINFSTRVYVRNNSSGKQGTIKFIKNNLSLYADAGSSYSVDRGPRVRIYNCQIGAMYFRDYSYPDILFYNCYVQNPYWDANKYSQTTTTFVNCVIRYTSYSLQAYAYYLNFYNCIFNNTSDSSDKNVFPKTVTCYNCLSINQKNLFNTLVSGGNNKTVDNVTDVFTTYTSLPNEGETFELTDAAKEAYIGTDGTQIGMQGGNYPYTTTVQYPIITKFTSDSQTNKEGILNVEIEVDGK